jgi:2-polyprenyl-6-methoxyphenol hydroxylase-like FAD-dependent oxidoreductase
MTAQKIERRNVLIVGGGPAGLATALMLAQRGWKDITVLEKRTSADYYEPDKSFNYLIDGRGQKFTDLLGLSDRLPEIGVPNTEFYLTQIKADGSRKTSKLPQVDPNRKTAYWMQRKTFVSFLYQEIERNWQDAIAVLFDTQCLQIDRQKKLKVIARNGDSQALEFEPSFLVGCDGINSIVRDTLQDWDRSARFEMKHFPSPSSGLKYKVLTLPPKFPLDRLGEERSVSTMAYAIGSVFKDNKRSMRLGILPFKNPDEPRTANIITKPNHQIWELKTGEEVSDFLERAFPQLPIRNLVSSQEADRFAKSEGGEFPEPQYCSGLHYLLDNDSGVVLLGDTVHCFPPDIGQGVNSALEDVCVLDRALEQSKDELSSALPLYESMRLPDVKALVRLAQTAFPWQYNQDRLGKFLWSINFFLRLILGRIPYLFEPPSFFLIQNHQLPYREIWSMAQRTTQSLYALGLIMLGIVLTIAFKINVPGIS